MNEEKRCAAFQYGQDIINDGLYQGLVPPVRDILAVVQNPVEVTPEGMAEYLAAILDLLQDRELMRYTSSYTRRQFLYLFNMLCDCIEEPLRLDYVSDASEKLTALHEDQSTYMGLDFHCKPMDYITEKLKEVAKK